MARSPASEWTSSSDSARSVSAPALYYPHPVPRLVYYRDKYNEDLSRFPNAARIADQSIALPVGPHIGEDDMDYIAQEMTKIVKELSCSNKS